MFKDERKMVRMVLSGTKQQKFTNMFVCFLILVPKLINCNISISVQLKHVYCCLFLYQIGNEVAATISNNYFSSPKLRCDTKTFQVCIPVVTLLASFHTSCRFLTYIFSFVLFHSFGKPRLNGWGSKILKLECMTVLLMNPSQKTS